MRGRKIIPILAVIHGLFVLGSSTQAQNCNCNCRPTYTSACGQCQVCGRCGCCPQGGAVLSDGQVRSETGEPQSLADDIDAETSEPFEPQQNFALASTSGAASGPSSAAPNMIGDFFGSGGFFSFSSFGTARVPIAAGDRTYKIAENTNPLPTNRFFVNYHHFHNALITDDNAFNLDRYTFGGEYAFNGNSSSIELRVPFAHGLAGNQILGEAATGTEFGNMSLVYKTILCGGGRSFITGGLGVTIPTADDATLSLVAGEPADAIAENDAFHLLPFIGWSYRPNDRVFYTAFAQVDFDANGNTIVFNDVFNGSIVGSETGRYQDQTLLHLDIAGGFWMYRNPCGGYVRGIAPTVELHYTTTLQDTDVVAADGGVGEFSNPFNRLDALNLTAGFHVLLCDLSTITVAGVAPLRKEKFSDDFTNGDLPDAEMTVQYNRRF